MGKSREKDKGPWPAFKPEEWLAIEDRLDIYTLRLSQKHFTPIHVLVDEKLLKPPKVQSNVRTQRIKLFQLHSLKPKYS